MTIVSSIRLQKLNLVRSNPSKQATLLGHYLYNLNVQLSNVLRIDNNKECNGSIINVFK